ncbi:hypothetical protein BpOF4_21979 (plasmid) [Alkalihalophilus pseudofirmus OF4]|uniref:Uncharacterized protein n=1 Tax=Alkalihalophilus pseudofirmus (strain ATCC BAA-2126 / JCM 17055 / OF4) TaxID=398511 RepID=D3G215_ALKPO|nr:hypothetical protein BpOF4_21979 [Alkalihalophilus pseudofirmus OF4]
MSTNRIFLSLFAGSIIIWVLYLFSYNIFNILFFSFSTIILISSIIVGGILERLEQKYSQKIYLLYSMIIYIVFLLLLYLLFLIELNVLLFVLFGALLSLVDFIIVKLLKRDSLKVIKVRVILIVPLLIYAFGFMVTLFL